MYTLILFCHSNTLWAMNTMAVCDNFCPIIICMSKKSRNGFFYYHYLYIPYDKWIKCEYWKNQNEKLYSQHYNLLSIKNLSWLLTIQSSRILLSKKCSSKKSKNNLNPLKKASMVVYGHIIFIMKFHAVRWMEIPQN